MVDESDEASSNSPLVKLDIYLPMEFDTQVSRIMNAKVELVFEREEYCDEALDNLFFATSTVENNVEMFFRDKYYQETIFAQDKLEEYLTVELKKSRRWLVLVRSD